MAQGTVAAEATLPPLRMTTCGLISAWGLAVPGVKEKQPRTWVGVAFRPEAVWPSEWWVCHVAAVRTSLSQGLWSAQG